MRFVYNAPVVLTFVILSLVLLGVDTLLGGTLSAQYFVAPATFQLSAPASWTGSALHILGHAGMSHWMGNMTFILLLGPLLEEKYGSFALLVMIVATAIATAVINAFFFDSGLIGASGIVFMMIVLSSVTGIREKEIPLTMVIVLILYLGKEIADSVRADNVSQFAHLLGGVCGAAFGLLTPNRTLART